METFPFPCIICRGKFPAWKPLMDLRGRLLSGSRITRDPLPTIEWAVEPLIARGSRTVLFGEYSTFKSWLLMHLALHLACGRPWFGHYTIPKPLSVLYIDEECGDRELRRRIKRLSVGEALPVGDAFQAYTMEGIRFSDHGARVIIAHTEADGFSPDVVIVETLRRVIVGNENEGADVAGFWNNIKPFLKAGKTFIVSHHMRKPALMPGPANLSRHRASGHHDILAGTDAAFAVTRQGTHDVEIEHIKARGYVEQPPFTVRFVAPYGQDTPVRLVNSGQPMTYTSPPASGTGVPSATPSRGDVPVHELCQLYPTLSHRQIYLQHVRTRGIGQSTYYAYLKRRGCTHRPGGPPALSAGPFLPG